MKKNFGIILAIAFVLSALLLTIAFQAGWVQAEPFFQTNRIAEPEIVSYQGQIWEGDVPYTGDGYFKFIILDGKGEMVWSNDGNLEPIAILLPVTNGLFSVLLGDLSIENMSSPLTADVFVNPGATLHVWFSPDNALFTRMPEQKIASVPYALQAQYAQNADTLDGIDSSTFQLRVTGSCSVGQAVRAINSDGTVMCETLAASPTFSISTLAFANQTGLHTSITIGTDGLGLISYRDMNANDLIVSHCNDMNCLTASSTSVDPSGWTGDYSSITIGSDGLGLISYQSGEDDSLKVFHCADTACTSGNAYVLDSLVEPYTWGVGEYTSIAIGTDNLGLISYLDSENQFLKVAHCNNINCSTAALSTLDNSGMVGGHTSVTTGSDGLGLISYYVDGMLGVAHCADTSCSSATLYLLDSIAGGWLGQFTSIEIGSDSLGLISYWDGTYGDLKVAHCNNVNCSSASVFTLDSLGNVGQYTSLAIGRDGLGLISYLDSTNGNLKVAHCNDDLCSGATTYTLDFLGQVGSYSSLVIGADGMGLISYHENVERDLKVVHCSNEFCMPINWEH